MLLALSALAAALASPLRLLTFDLDDTLFPCGRVVQRANAVLGAQLEALGAAAADIQGSIREVRTEHAAAGGGALTYSELRRRAIARILGGTARPEAVDRCFDAWLHERQAAADALLFEGAVETLSRVRADHPRCVVGAVTNGRGDPRGMPRLAGLFDFCVSGEDDDVWPERKPSVGIYEHALRRGGDAERLRASWVHVGDCLVNDVEASKRAGARTVWFDSPHDALASYSTASAEEEERRDAARAAALAAGLVDARIEALGALPEALERVLAPGGSVT